MPVERKNLLGEALSAVREAIRDSETGSAHPPSLVGSAPALRLQEPRNLVRAAAGPLTAASVRNASPSEFPTYFSGALAN